MIDVESVRWIGSETHPGVEFAVRRMSFGRRLELMRNIRDLAARLQFFEAGQDARNRMEAALLGGEIDRLYVLWGVTQIKGLDIDGSPATPESLVDRGPEELFNEALSAVKTQCGLSENERKN